MTNDAFRRLVAVPVQDGQWIYEAQGGAWNTDDMHALLEVELARDVTVQRRRIRIDIAGGNRSMLVDGYLVCGDGAGDVPVSRFFPRRFMKPKRAGGKKALRQQAERILTGMAAAPPAVKYQDALHELQVHQVELELQVEELRRTESALQEMRDRYLSLYDEAPVGYVTLDRYNLITQANRAAAKILGMSKVSLRTRRFSSFLERSSRGTFLDVSADARASGARRTFDAQLGGDESSLTWVKLDLAAEATTGELRITLADITQQRVAERELRQLADGLIKLQERERKSVAETLHDDAGQQLTYLSIILDQTRETGAGLDQQRIDQLGDVTRKILQEIRTLSASLSPAELSRVGLPGAVQGMVSEFTGRTRIPVSFASSGSFKGQPFEVSLAAYRIIQEALTNAARHAHPTAVTVTLRHSAAQVFVQVRDDGTGFDAEKSPMSLGLLSMRERARAVGGTLRVVSSPGNGTSVIFEIVRGKQPASGEPPQASTPSL